MSKTIERFIISILFLAVCLLLVQMAFAADLPIDKIKLPPGFKIEIFARGIPNARSMALSPKGILFVGTRTEGKVYAVLDQDKDGKADSIHIIVHGMRSPSGVAIKDGALYIAEINRIWRLENIDENWQKLNPGLIYSDLPTDGWHGWKYISFGPDGKLYVPVGAPCNTCEREDARYASILRMDPDGKNMEVFAKGIRNTVGFDWDPRTKELWFTDNGRDNLGDNVPPDELNRAPKPGMNFGFPYCHGKNIPDPEFNTHPCKQFTPPAQELGPHVAALGMKFYTGNMFPKEYRNQIFIAEHGSWNRTQPLGYRIMLVRLKGRTPASYEIFAEGWLGDKGAWGRPVDILNMPDGSLLVSDDHAGVIYRITYNIDH